MSGSPLWLLLPVCVGLSQPVIWQMNLAVSSRSGVMESAVVLHLVGTVVGLCWVLGGLRGSPGFAGLATVPWWAFAAGALGVTGMAVMNRTMPVLGVSAALAILVASQFGASLIFEHLGLLGTPVRLATASRCLGALLLAAGAWLMSR